MRTFPVFGAVCAYALMLIFHAQSFAQSAIVNLPDFGRIEGFRDNGLLVYRGIPYAEPPVGELRWRAPRPVRPWRNIRRAEDLGPACPQAPAKDIRAEAMSEDCLTLNVWRPARRADRLPVMVWIHGGGFNAGSARQPIYDGANLARQGVIVVTLNYRLGYLGFLGHPQLTEEAKAESVPTANYGLLDQLAALQWVQHNIEAFGGDPSNVTLFGESAGGVSILALMTAPSARGLFAKVIIESGGGRWVAPSLTSASGRFPSAYEYGQKAAKALGVDPANPIAGLRAKSWQEIRNALNAFPELNAQTPFLDGQLLTDQIEPVFERGDQAQVPMIVGANSYEGLLLRGAFNVPRDNVFRAVGDRVDELSDLYRRQLIMTPDSLADHIWGDANFVEPARMIARAVSRTGQPVYHYEFDFLPPLLRILGGGTPHGLEVVYAFGNLKLVVPFPFAQLMHPHNYEVSRLMVRSWTEFAKTSNPNGRDEGYKWRPFKPNDEETLVFGNRGITIEQDYSKERLDYFHGVIW